MYLLFSINSSFEHPHFDLFTPQTATFSMWPLLYQVLSRITYLALGVMGGWMWGSSLGAKQLKWCSHIPNDNDLGGENRGPCQIRGKEGGISWGERSFLSLTLSLFDQWMQGIPTGLTNRCKAYHCDLLTIVMLCAFMTGGQVFVTFLRLVLAFLKERLASDNAKFVVCHCFVLPSFPPLNTISGAHLNA